MVTCRYGIALVRIPNPGNIENQMVYMHLHVYRGACLYYTCPTIQPCNEYKCQFACTPLRRSPMCSITAIQSGNYHCSNYKHDKTNHARGGGMLVHTRNSSSHHTFTNKSTYGCTIQEARTCSSSQQYNHREGAYASFTFRVRPAVLLQIPCWSPADAKLEIGNPMFMHASRSTNSIVN